MARHVAHPRDEATIRATVLLAQGQGWYVDPTVVGPWQLAEPCTIVEEDVQAEGPVLECRGVEPVQHGLPLERVGVAWQLAQSLNEVRLGLWGHWIVAGCVGDRTEQVRRDLVVGHRPHRLQVRGFPVA